MSYWREASLEAREAFPPATRPTVCVNVYPILTGPPLHTYLDAKKLSPFSIIRSMGSFMAKKKREGSEWVHEGWWWALAVFQSSKEHRTSCTNQEMKFLVKVLSEMKEWLPVTVTRKRQRRSRVSRCRLFLSKNGPMFSKEVPNTYC